MTTPDQESKLRRRWPTYLAIVLVLMLIVYPLSVGPAAVIVCRNASNDSLVKTYLTIYWPVLCAAEMLGADKPLSRYEMWWLQTTNTPLHPS